MSSTRNKRTRKPQRELQAQSPDDAISTPASSGVSPTPISSSPTQSNSPTVLPGNLLRDSLPDAVGGLLSQIAFTILAVVYSSTGWWFIILLCEMLVWGFLVWVAFSRHKSGAVRDGIGWRYAAQRPVALVFIVILPLISSSVAISFEMGYGKFEAWIIAAYVVVTTSSWVSCVWVFFRKELRQSVSLRTRVKSYVGSLFIGKRVARGKISSIDTASSYFYPLWFRRVMLLCTVAVTSIPLMATGVYLWPPSKTIVVVARFSGPDPERYRVSDVLWQELGSTLQKYEDVEFQKVDRIFDDAESARSYGRTRKATIVVWGWYGATENTVPLSMHFEVLRPPEIYPEFGPELKGQVQTIEIGKLDGMELQGELTKQINFLVLFTVGMTRFTSEQWDEAIDLFSAALAESPQNVPGLNRGIAYYYRGDSYLFTESYDLAVADYSQSLNLNPRDPAAHHNRGYAYLVMDRYDDAIVDLGEAIKYGNNSSSYLNRGVAFMSKQDYAQAIRDFDVAIEMDPNDTSGYNNRGGAYSLSCDCDRAIVDFNSAIKIDDRDHQLYINRGAAYEVKGSYTLALEDYSKAISIDLKDIDPIVRRATLYATMGRLELATADFNRALTLDSQDPMVYLSRGIVFMRQSRYDDAVIDLMRAIELGPDNASSYVALGSSYYEKGDIYGAIAEFTTAINVGFKDKDDLWDAYARRGAAYGKLGEYDKSIADLDVALKGVPNNPYAYRNRQRALTLKEVKSIDASISQDPTNKALYFERGTRYISIQEYESAIADLTRAVELDGRYAEAIAAIGEVYAMQERYDDAILYFDRAIGVNSSLGIAYANRASVYFKKGNITQAIKDLDDAVRYAPDEYSVYYNRGTTYLELGNFDKAISDLDMAISINPDNPWAYNNRGNTYANMGQLDPALKDFTESLRIKPDHLSALINRGMLYIRRQEYANAVKDLTLAIKVDPLSYSAYSTRGRAYAERGDLDAAFADFSEALNLRPDDEETLNNRAHAYLGQGKTREAVADWRRILETGTNEEMRAHASEHLSSLGVR